MRVKAFLLLGCWLAAVLFGIGCRKPVEAPPQVPPSVTIIHPMEEMVTNSIELTGVAAASRSVDLVARVSGYLQTINFEDGTFVEEGRLLFAIEPDTYEQQLRLAQAELTKSQAEYDRQTELLKNNATSVANVEKWLSQRDQAAAQVELAKLNLGYTSVSAPFSGYIGRRQVDPGNLVSPSGNVRLATLDQIIPIYVYFNLNERDALQVREMMRKQGMTADGGAVGKAPVFVGLQNEEGYPHEGTLDFLDRAVSTSTGTIEMRVVLKNEDKTFFPGLFARIKIPVGEAQPMRVVPGAAFGNDQEGDYVLVVGDGEVVARRTIVKGPMTKTGCAVRSGLAPEDRVIVSGLMNARPGARVTVAKPNTADLPPDIPAR
ncbi:MAG: Multidrug export protein AcrE precursor [Planctomycetes bacterium ADurb.Bin412]|nr:MAG: Multidrug export protein AcrE precursor [Planctomycetes bacterium ADurb.Bin412]